MTSLAPAAKRRKSRQLRALLILIGDAAVLALIVFVALDDFIR